QVQRDEALRAQLVNEIDVKRQQLALDDPQRVLIRKHQQENFDSIRRLRDIAERQFQVIQHKYGSIEPKGPEIVALRTVPQLSLDGNLAPVVFRISVPTEREVWLKYALVPAGGGSQASEKLDQILESHPGPGFEHSGPFQRRLPSGECILQVDANKTIDNMLPVSIRLNDQVILESSFTGDGVPRTGSFHISGQTQLDFPVSRPLPWLLNIQIRVEQQGGAHVNAPADGCLWLSTKPSDFEDFPLPKNAK
ncbi:MAG: hypothetical protein KDB00_27655, partial [Planctomycetales bacterium]|nr:hypothetical protein [Planctomycetales bacterium]